MDKNEFKAADVQVDDATVARSIAAEEIRVAEQQMRADEAMARSLSGGGGGGGGGGGADGKADDDAEGFGGDRTGSAIVTVVGTVVRPELNVLVVLPAGVRFTRCSLLLSLRPRHLCHVPHTCSLPPSNTRMRCVTPARWRTIYCDSTHNNAHDS